jgi:outer membrane protein
MYKLLLIVLIGTLSTNSIAQKNIGYVQTDEIIDVLPDRLEAQKYLLEHTNKLQAELASMTSVLEEKVLKCQQLPRDTPISVIEAKQNELVDMQARIERYQEDAQNEILILEEELLKPIIEKVKIAISVVAKEQNYGHIFDLSSGNVLVFPDSDDITVLVMKELGI